MTDGGAFRSMEVTGGGSFGSLEVSVALIVTEEAVVVSRLSSE